MPLTEKSTNVSTNEEKSDGRFSHVDDDWFCCCLVLFSIFFFGLMMPAGAINQDTKGYVYVNLLAEKLESFASRESHTTRGSRNW